MSPGASLPHAVRVAVRVPVPEFVVGTPIAQVASEHWNCLLDFGNKNCSGRKDQAERPEVAPTLFPVTAGIRRRLILVSGVGTAASQSPSVHPGVPGAQPLTVSRAAPHTPGLSCNPPSVPVNPSPCHPAPSASPLATPSLFSAPESVSIFFLRSFVLWIPHAREIMWRLPPFN